MPSPARVGSIDALREFRDALLVFTDEAQQVLAQAEGDVARACRQVGEERLAYWESERRRREERVVQLKVELGQAKWAKAEGSSLVDERKRLARAQDGLEEARQKLAACKRWRRELEKERSMFKGQVEGLRRWLEGESPRALRRLEEMSKRLDEYVHLAGPSAGDASGREGRVPGSADQPAGSASRGLATSDTSTADSVGDPGGVSGDSGADELVAMRHAAERMPAPATDQTRDATAGDLPRYRLCVDDRRALAKVAGPPADLRRTVLVGRDVSHADRVVHHRVAPADSTDSGWRLIGWGERSEAASGDRDAEASGNAESLRAASAVRAAPVLAEILRLGPGWTVITGEAGLLALFDPNGRRRFPTLAAEAEGDE